MVELKKIAEQFSQASTIEKVNTFPITNVVTSISLIAFKIINDLRITRLFTSKPLFIKNYSYSYLLVSAFPVISTIVHLVLFSKRAKKIDHAHKMEQKKQLAQEKINNFIRMLACMKRYDTIKKARLVELEEEKEVDPPCLRNKTKSFCIMALATSFTAINIGLFAMNHFGMMPQLSLNSTLNTTS